MTRDDQSEIEKLRKIVEELYELAPPISMADSPSQARRLETLYEKVREVLIEND